MTQVYFAAPLFTAAERAWNLHVLAELGAHLPTVTWSIPQEFCAPFETSGQVDHGAIYNACHQHLAQAQLVIAVLDGSDVDSGTAWEAGFACARGIPVIGMRTDLRPAEDGAANCMLTRSCAALCHSVEELAAALQRLLPPEMTR
jgi:nucleoside 2-deoxyribosyltransferase